MYLVDTNKFTPNLDLAEKTYDGQNGDIGIFGNLDLAEKTCDGHELVAAELS